MTPSSTPSPPEEIATARPQVAIYQTLDELGPLREEWDNLLSSVPTATIFSSWEWLTAWWRAFANEDRLKVLAFREASGRLIGLAPLAVTVQRWLGRELRLLRFMGDGSHDSDNLDIPVLPGWEAECSPAFLDWLEQRGHDWDLCQLNTLAEGSPMGSRLRQDLMARQWTIFTSSRPWSVIELPETWEGYLKSLSSKERGKIGLRARRLEKRYAIRMRRCADSKDLGPCLEALFTLHRKHWRVRGLPGTLSMPQRQQFYFELSSSLLARGWLEFWLLELEGVPVAAQFGLRYKTTLYSLQEGFDPDYASDSVGYVLRANVLKYAISEGMRRYDFLAGTDDSKLRWGAHVQQYVNLEFARPFSAGSACLKLNHASRHVKGWMRGHLPTQMFRAIKRLRGASAGNQPTPEVDPRGGSEGSTD